MIRFTTSRIWKGKRVRPNDMVWGLPKEMNALLDCGQAYEDEIDEEPDMSNTKQEIIDYLNGHYIEHDPKQTKAELLELI